MANLILRPSYYLPEKQVTPEHVFLNRRRFMRQLGLAGAGALSIPMIGCSQSGAAEKQEAVPESASKPAGIATEYPAPRNGDFDPDWRLTREKVAATYNNFYEFTLQKDVHKYVDDFTIEPWAVQISGLVDNPLTLSPDEMVGEFGLEERVYRFRCVEAWAMVVPWTGFPLSKLIEKAKPKSEARFVRFETANKPEEMPGIEGNPGYPWPYFEGLRMDEAMNPLTMMVTGVYGKPLPKQHGAPIRLVVPWKYGYKSIKSIVKMEFIAEQPKTFWETLQPNEYPFESNVNPNVPHPRWSQATHRMIDTNDRERTQIYNGYSDYVADLYPNA